MIDSSNMDGQVPAMTRSGRNSTKKMEIMRVIVPKRRKKRIKLRKSSFPARKGCVPTRK
jgi:hypothetical protein